MLDVRTRYARRYTCRLFEEQAQRLNDLARQLAQSVWAKKALYRDPNESEPFTLSGSIAQDLLGMRRGKPCCLRSAQKALKRLIDAGVVVWTGVYEAGFRLFKLAHPDSWFRRPSHETTVSVVGILSKISFKLSGSDHCTELHREERDRRDNMPSPQSGRTDSNTQRIQPKLSGEPAGPEGPPPSVPESSLDVPASTEGHPNSESLSTAYRRRFGEARKRESFPYEAPSDPRKREAERRKVHSRLAALENLGWSFDDFDRVLAHVVERAGSYTFAAENLASHKILLPDRFQREIDYLQKQNEQRQSGGYCPIRIVGPPPTPWVPPTPLTDEQIRRRDEAIATLVPDCMKDLLGSRDGCQEEKARARARAEGARAGGHHQASSSASAKDCACQASIGHAPTILPAVRDP